ncbi:MAG: glycoside hydrolase family 92 protein, partial [Candidatus Lokiarchaeota archaeon]|nr:glycoside hydrolase family 92 protein [Candidatus Lokiarchaeota archaeon]
NQPDIHVPFMFNFGDAPWLTQKWVNEILTKETVQYYGTHEKWDEPYTGRIYKADPEGYIPEMDDDEGTMSGWFVLSSMGMYPVLVGDPVFQLSTPIFDKIMIRLANQKTFTIVTENFSNTSYYIKSATLNGEPFNQSYITHDQIVNGGTLVIRTSTEPNKEWGRGVE